MQLILIAFLATFVLTASVLLLVFRRDVVLSRLSLLVGDRNKTSRFTVEGILPAQQASVETLVKPFQNILPRSSAEVSVIKMRLIRAGYRDRNAVNIFYGCKVLVPLVLGALVTVTGIYESGPLFFYGVAIGLGFLLPDFFLSNRISNRQRKIRLGLPEALDLMVICTEAGLGLDQTLYRVGQEIAVSQPEICEEFKIINLEQKAGRPRDETLKNFADRVNIDSVRSLATTLIQADNFGTSVAKTLRVYSDTLRTQRRQHAEEMAAKTTVKLVFPLVLFIFPSIFIVALGPAMITMMEGFSTFFN